MEEKIKRVAARTKMLFVYFWMLPVFLVVFGETGGEWVGDYAGDVRATYFAETVTILLTAVLVPVSLKLFSWVLTKQIDVVAITDALRLYVLWSGVRPFVFSNGIGVGNTCRGYMDCFVYPVSMLHGRQLA